MSRPRRPPEVSWKIFLNTHREVIGALDFFTVPTITFRIFYVLLIIQHDRRKVLHVNVRAHPTAAWVSQQLREPFRFECRPRYVLMDRDSIFSAEVCRASLGVGVGDDSTGTVGVAKGAISMGTSDDALC